MGYVTEYRLRVSYDTGVDPEATAQLIMDYIRTDPDLSSIGLVPDALPFEPVRYSGHWYNYEKDIKKIARQFPGCSFLLHGKGEEADDEWETEFRGNSSRYRAVAIRWSEWSSEFEGKYDSAYYTLYIDLPADVKVSDACPEIIAWMCGNAPDWAQVFDLSSERPVKVFESNAAVEWYGYAQMHDLAAAFPKFSFELRCTPVKKGSEYVYRICGTEESFRQTKLTWIEWSIWR